MASAYLQEVTGLVLATLPGDECQLLIFVRRNPFGIRDPCPT
jgi:hypothetical protein